MVEGAWIMTDDDSCQHVRQLGPKVFQLIEMQRCGPNRNNFHVYSDTIFLPDYSDAEIATVLECFGYTSQSDVIAKYGDGANQIIAECIFEHYGPYRCEPIFQGSEVNSKLFVEHFCSNKRPTME